MNKFRMFVKRVTKLITIDTDIYGNLAEELSQLTPFFIQGQFHTIFLYFEDFQLLNELMSMITKPKQILRKIYLKLRTYLRQKYPK